MVDPWILLISVWLGSFAGDQFWFTLGRRFGERAIRRIPGAAARLPAAMGFINRFGNAFILMFRFAYGIRNVAAAACGMAGINRLRFAVLNFIAAGLWSATFVAAGWYVAEWLGTEGVAWCIGAVGLLVIACLILRHRRIALTG